MKKPTINEVRRAKTRLLERLRGHNAFAGVGIGHRDGKLVVQVNWRTLPAKLDRLARVGNVEVAHQVVGDVKSQGPARAKD